MTDNARRRNLTALWLLAALSLPCIGCSIRETHTDRTSTEQLLISRAVERACRTYTPGDELRGRRVHVDASRLDAVDKPYVVSALRHQINESGAFLVPLEAQTYATPDGQEVKLGPELIVEVRSAAVGIKDSSFGFGIPIVPVPIPTTSLTFVIKPLYLLNRDKQEGWAKLQLWIYDPRVERFKGEARELWGHSYYSAWWFLLMGPFDFSYDNYPDAVEPNQTVPSLVKTSSE